MKENLVNYIPLKIYRSLRWQLQQRDIYFQNKRNESKEYADLCYHAQKAIWEKQPLEEQLSALKAKDDYVLAHVEEKCKDVIQRYQMTAQASGAGVTSSEKRIWVFWWTGEDTAPDIVKACIRSIRRNANGHEVVLLDKCNYFQYIDMPKEICEKHSAGVIGHAHFSDIVRMSLLAKWGGVWIDATVFLSQQLPEYLFSSAFFTARSVDDCSLFFSRSRWVGYFLAGNSTFPLFSFTRDMLIAYWERSDTIIDYLLMDYVFDIACKTIPEVRNAMDALPDNNLLRGKLMEEINEPYSEQLFDALQNGETFLSKLSWRYGGPRERTDDGKLTNYGHLLRL